MAVLKMERPMDSWNDERLNELSRRMDAGFKELREEMQQGFAQIDKRFEQVDKRFEQVDQRFEQVDQRFERIYLVMVTTSLGLVASVFGALVVG